MGCKCARYDGEDGRWRCSVSGDGCVFMIPNAKACAAVYGEGPDAVADNKQNTSNAKDLRLKGVNQ